MTFIPLTHGKSAIVDDAFSHLKNYPWQFFKHRSGYAKRGMKMEMGGYCNVLLHHCVIGFPLNDYQVDHINGDGLDNRLSNLRIVSSRENSCNRKIHRDGKLPGAKLDKRSKSIRPWYATIEIKGKAFHLGSYRTELEAHQIYKLASQNKNLILRGRT